MSNKKKSGSASVYPVDDVMLVRRIEQNITDAGIQLPEQRNDKVLKGVIAAVGPGLPSMSGERVAPQVVSPEGRLIPVRAEDGVLYKAEDAQELTIESGKFDLVRFRDAIAILKHD